MWCFAPVMSIQRKIVTKGVMLLVLAVSLSACLPWSGKDGTNEYVDFSQIVTQASKFDGHEITIRGYMKRSLADEGQFILVPRAEEFYSESFPPIRLYINVNKDISGCYGEYVALNGRFRIDDYGIKWLDVDYANAYITVEPLAERTLVITDQDERIGSVNCKGT